MGRSGMRDDAEVTRRRDVARRAAVLLACAAVGVGTTVWVLLELRWLGPEARSVEVGEVLLGASLVAIGGAALTLVPLLLLEHRRDLRHRETTVALQGVLAGRRPADDDTVRRRDDFLVGVSHSLRTSLHVITGTAQTLERHADRLDVEQRAELTRTLVRQAGRLDELVRDLLEVERLGVAGQPTPRPDVPVAGVLPAVRSAVDLGSRQLACDVGDVRVRLSMAHLERVLIHLVRNAAEHTPDGGRVVVRAGRLDDGTELVVEDDGPGIGPDDRRRVFEPLAVGVGVDAGASPGLGLGLALVRRIARSHGGRAWLADGPRGGTAAHVWIPDEAPPVAVDPFELRVLLSDAVPEGAR